MYMFENPFSYVANPSRSQAVGLAKMYFGLPDLDPSVEANQVQVYVVQPCGCDEPYLAISQPVRTSAGGVPTYNGVPVQLALDADVYSLSIKSSSDAHIYYTPRVVRPDDELRQGLADGTADVGGVLSSNLAVASISVPNLKALASVAGRVGIIYQVMEFSQNTGFGNHLVRWNPTRAWTAPVDTGLVWSNDMLGAWSGASGAISNLYSYSGSGVGCWERVNLELTPESFGAIPNAIFNSTLPIRRAVRVAVSSSAFQNEGDPTGMIKWSTGVYRITESGVFSDYGAIKRNGIKHVGTGPDNTIVWLDPSALSGDAWFYDNGATNRSWNSTYQDMGFRGGITWRSLGVGYSNFDSKVKGFNFTGPGWESAHVFSNCVFTWLDTIVKASGTNNADTFRFTQCSGSKCRLVNYLDNPQSMNITWDQCYLSNIFGDFAYWGSGVFGAGNLAFTNGTIVFTPDDFGGGVSWLVNTSVGGPTAANATVSFSNSRFEIKGVGASIANIIEGSTMVDFESCTFLSTANADRDIAIVGGVCSLTFRTCSLAQATTGKLNWVLKSTGRNAKNGTINITNTYLQDFRTLHTIEFDGGRGSMRIDNSWEEQVDYPTSSTEATVVTINGVYKGPTGAQDTGNRQSNLFVVDPLRGGSLPATGDVNTARVSLPPNSVLCGVFISFPAGTSGATASSYRLLVGNADKSVIYATSATVAQNAGLTFNEKIAVKMGATVADATVAVWADNGSGGTSGAGIISPVICYLEYY